MRIAIEPRLRLDIGLRDVAAGLVACATRNDRRGCERELLSTWGDPEGLACFSVRSAFDLLLEVLALPAGSEVAFSAITHPDVPRIARAHGLRVLPLDLDPDTLAPTAAAVELAVRPGTRLVVVAHLFGSRVDLEPLARRTAEVGALLVEDCAQTIRGPHDQGDPLADVSLFSFGAIKTATALGGAIVRVRDPQLAEALRRAQERLPVQQRSHQFSKLVKFSALVALCRPVLYGVLLRTLAALGRDPDAFVNGVVRAFPPVEARGDADAVEAARTEELLLRIRRAPSAPLLALVRRRLARFDERRLAARAATGEAVARTLRAPLVQPGGGAALRTHWVLPVVAPEPEKLVAALRAAGFDAARATSSIATVAPPPDRPDLRPRAAEAMMEGIVFVPAPPYLGAQRRRELVSALAAVVVTDSPVGDAILADSEVRA